MKGLLCLGGVLGLLFGILAEPLPVKTRKRPLISREGRFISTHLDLLSAASSLFPSFMAKGDLAPSKADKLVATEDDLSESETIKDMSGYLEDVQSFGAKLDSAPTEIEEVISDQIDAMDASGGDPPQQFEEIFEAKSIPYQEEAPKFVEVYKNPEEADYGRPSYGQQSYGGPPSYGGYQRPEGTPVPLVIICEDPNYCPPPSSYGNPYGQPRPSYGDGLTICKDPNDCPAPGAPYGNYPRPRPRPYRIKRPLITTEQPPTYLPSDPTKRPVKKYGYNPSKSNPTIWRQQVMKVRKPTVKDADKTEDHVQSVVGNEEAIRNIQKIQEDFVKSNKPTSGLATELDAEDIQQMSMDELKEFIKEAAMQEVEDDKSEKLVIADTVSSTVAPVVEAAINKMSMRELKDFIMETVMENEEDLIVIPISEADIKQMSMRELKEVIKETVIQNESPEELVVPLVEDVINKMSMKELKEIIMETTEEKESNEEIVVPLVEEAINSMSMMELKEFIEETVVQDEDDTEEIVAPLVEEAVNQMSRVELKEFIMENVVEKEDLKTTPVNEDDINNMSMEDLREFIKDSSMAVADTGSPTVAPIVEESINKMSIRELEAFIMEIVMENENDLIVLPISEEAIKQMSMQELKEVIKETVIQNEAPEELVVPLVEEAIKQMSRFELKEFIMENVVEKEDLKTTVTPLNEDDINNMSMEELREFIKDSSVAVADTGSSTVAPVVEESINKMSMRELKDFIMETVMENENDLIVLPISEEAIKQMSMEELKEVIKETVIQNEAPEELVVPLVEEAINQMSRVELKEFIMENVVEKEDLKTTVAPRNEDDINNMSMEELREFIKDSSDDNMESEKINVINNMSMEELREFINESPIDNVESGEITAPTNEDDINQMSMEELREFIEDNSFPPATLTEKPFMKNEMILKDGMLMKDGMTMKEIKATEMGMTVKEMVSMVEGLTREEVKDIKEGVSVEEMIAMKNDVTVEEMVAMKNDLTMQEVMEIKEVMTVEDILEEKPEIAVEEVVALKSDMTVEEMVAMKNDVSVEEIIELKEEITMREIMSLQDGMTKEDIVAIVENVVTVQEVIEMKEKLEQISETNGIQIVPNQRIKTELMKTDEPIMGMEGLKEMAGQMEIIDINGPDNGGVKFIEIFNNPEMMEPTNPTTNTESLDTNNDFQATRIPMRGSTMTEKLKTRGEQKETRKKLKMKMRPMRVKVRKPAKKLPPFMMTKEKKTQKPNFGFGNDDVEPAKKFQSFMMTNEKKAQKPNFGFGDDDMDTMLDEAFGLKNGFTNDDLVLEPTPAVPGRPVTVEEEEEPSRTRIQFKEFLPSTTPRPVIPVDNIKTVDFQKEDMSDSPMDYPIYDTESNKPFPPLKMSEFPLMPIFSNFPMMGPNEFVQPSPTQSPENPRFSGYAEESSDYEDYMDKASLTAFRPERPESINLFKDEETKISQADDDLESLVNIFNEEAPIEPEVRPVRRPNQRPIRPSSYNGVHPNHRYPLNKPTSAPVIVTPTPFTVRSKNTIVPHSYMKNSYKHTASEDNFRTGYSPNGNFEQSYSRPNRPLHSFGNFDTSNTALFRDIPDEPTRNKVDERFKRKPYQETPPSYNDPKPFTTFGNPRQETKVKPTNRIKKIRPTVGFSKNYDVKPFTHFREPSVKENNSAEQRPQEEVVLPPRTVEGKVEEEEVKEEDNRRDYNDPSLVGLNFYKQYGQHDDRPLQLPTASSPTEVAKEDVEYQYDEASDGEDEKPKRRPGEIRFGGMSFALPPPGAFPDIPEEEEYEYESDYDYDARPVSDVYPNHPISSVFPNRPVSDVFRDLPDKKADPKFPTAFPTGSGISIEESASVDAPGFENFFNSQSSYLDNPFGGDFIKLEIDRDRFDTNKTGPGVHHIPLDVYGYPDVPTYKTSEESSYGPKLPMDKKMIEEPSNKKTSKSKPSKPLFKSKKPLYKPPPVLTEYEPPKNAQYEPKKNPQVRERIQTQVPEYRHQYPTVSAQKNKKKEAMANLPNALQNLPMFMERLMGNHADWVQRAWKGRERDESAAA